jgi:hypothetical protein
MSTREELQLKLNLIQTRITNFLLPAYEAAVLDLELASKNNSGPAVIRELTAIFDRAKAEYETAITQRNAIDVNIAALPAATAADPVSEPPPVAPDEGTTATTPEVPSPQLLTQGDPQPVVLSPLVEAPSYKYPPNVPILAGVDDPTGTVTSGTGTFPVATRDVTRRGLSELLTNTQAQATKQDTSNFKQLGDWRVRLSLAPGATYLYKDPNVLTSNSILLPLAQTDGVIFPYTPAISVSYVADYAPTNVTHSNYTFNSYSNSKVENITIGCDFTAQDTAEATYLLAVIHFFKSVTKMFYGRDNNPKNGTPPPLCYINGLGAFQFDEHPLAITAFNYTLPTDVDYIRAGIPTTDPGVNKSPQTTKSNSSSTSGERLNNNNLSTGGRSAPPVFSINYSTREPTYVPTKISLAITAIPIITRNDISNIFSLEKYATGELLRKGIW